MGNHMLIHVKEMGNHMLIHVKEMGDHMPIHVLKRWATICLFMC